MPLPKTPYIYEAIDKAINAFGDHHNLNGRKHFSHPLGFDGANGDIQMGSMLNCSTYNPANPKAMSVDQFNAALNNLGKFKKIPLDALARLHGGVFNFSAPAKVENESIKDELLTIASFAGSLSAKFLEYKNNDGRIDENEADELERIAYETRQHLSAFEEMVQKHKKELED